MPTAETISGLAAFERRGAGTDAERRAARWLCDELAAAGRDARVEPFWCRPDWALAHGWHVALGIVGSLVSVASPRVGAALVFLALLSVFADALTGWSLGRRLTPERASQNVFSSADHGDHRVRLIITANYDAGRTGLVYGDALIGLRAWLRRATAHAAPGWIAWVAIALAWLLAIAVLRLGGHTHGTALGIAQLVPTVALVLALALLIELASSDYAPGAGDNASGVAVALALVRALDAAPPRSLAVEVVFQGASDNGAIGMRRHLRTHRRSLKPTNTVVLGIAACGAGLPRWWVSDGSFVPMRYLKRLRDLCAGIAQSESHLQAAPHRGRGATPPLAARAVGLPAIAIGCLDRRGLSPRSHTQADAPDALESAAMDGCLEFALALVDAIDADLAGHD